MSPLQSGRGEAIRHTLPLPTLPDALREGPTDTHPIQNFPDLLKGLQPFAGHLREGDDVASVSRFHVRQSERGEQPCVTNHMSGASK